MSDDVKAALEAVRAVKHGEVTETRTWKIADGKIVFQKRTVTKVEENKV